MCSKEIVFSNSSMWTICLTVRIRMSAQNKKKHKISPILILTNLNPFFRKAHSLFLFLFSFANLSSGSAAMLSMLRLIFSSLLKCLLASTNTKELDIKSAIIPVITTARNVITHSVEHLVIFWSPKIQNTEDCNHEYRICYSKSPNNSYSNKWLLSVVCSCRKIAISQQLIDLQLLK